MVKSTLAAEAASLSVGQDRNEFARVAVAYFFGLVRLDQRMDWLQVLTLVPGYFVVDAKSLYDMLTKDNGLPSEKRVALDLLAVREALKRDQDRIFWIPTAWMLADSFTKEMNYQEALDLLLMKSGYSLKAEALENAARNFTQEF